MSSLHLSAVIEEGVESPHQEIRTRDLRHKKRDADDLTTACGDLTKPPLPPYEVT